MDTLSTLTHWGRDKMDAISQTIFSSAFPIMKMFEFRLKFHWSLFLRVQLTIVHHWFRWWFGAVQAPSHYLNQWWWVYWRIFASLGLNELMVLFEGNPQVTGGYLSQRVGNGRALMFMMMLIAASCRKNSRVVVIWDAMTLMFCH